MIAKTVFMIREGRFMMSTGGDGTMGRIFAYISFQFWKLLAPVYTNLAFIYLPFCP